MNEFGKKHQFILASARAGNVIGGGDWSEDRLIPDLVKNVVSNTITTIRSPFATRPWQHVLEPISGYLVLGQRILEGDITVSEGWNFGPEKNETKSVNEVLEISNSVWNKIKYNNLDNLNQPHEASLLRLDCRKANNKLNWKPVWDTKESIHKTINWYMDFYIKNKLNTETDLMEYIKTAKNKKLTWTK